MIRSLSVWWDGLRVGTLRLTARGRMTFAYTAEWLADRSRQPLSMSLPKRAQPFRHRECRPFFAGLLPEDAQLDAVAHALGLSRSNDFQLLACCTTLSRSRLRHSTISSARPRILSSLLAWR